MHEHAWFLRALHVRQRPQAFALYGLTVVSAPAIGPVLGGWITDSLSWHWVFLINLPVGLLSLFLVHNLVVEPDALKEDRRRALRGGLRIDYVGFALVALGFGALQIVLDRFNIDDGFGSSFILVLSLVAGTALATPHRPGVRSARRARGRSMPSQTGFAEEPRLLPYEEVGP